MSDAVSTTGILVKRRPAVLPATVVLTASAVGDPSVLTTAAPHLLTDGDTVIIAGHAGSTPDINGTYSVTVVDADSFTIPVAVTVAGAGGTIQRDFQTIGEITKVTPPGYSRNKIQTSTHNEGTESNVLGILRQRDAAFTINYVADNLTHIDILDDIVLNRKNTWQIAFPSGILYTATARVQQFMLGDAPVDAAQTADCVITWAQTVQRSMAA
jgi:hypothetical protein